MSNTKNINTIEIGNIKLPGGFETTSGILLNMFEYLDIRSLLNFIETSLIKQFGSDDFKVIINNLIQKHPARSLYLLIERYRREFPRYGHRDEIPTPIVCACERGRMDDVELFMNLHPFHKYITNRDVNGYRDDMTLKDMVSQVGKISHGIDRTPLMAAAAENEHFQVVQYLIEQGEADPNIGRINGQNALHWAAQYNKKDTKVIEFLLTNMSLNSINKKDRYVGYTPLDYAYNLNESPIKQAIIDLIRSKGGKRGREL